MTGTPCAVYMRVYAGAALCHGDGTKAMDEGEGFMRGMSHSEVRREGSGEGRLEKAIDD